MARKAVVASSNGNTAMLRKTKLCRFFEEGECAKGDACSFAHSTRDLQSRPNLLKTQFCLAFQRNGYCRDGAKCKYAHGDGDLKSDVQQLRDALPKPIGLQVRPGSVATRVLPVPVPVPVMVATSASKPPIRGPTSTVSALPFHPMPIITKGEKWAFPVTDDEPDTPSTMCGSPWESERTYASDSASIISSDAWDRQVSGASSDSISSENWREHIKDGASDTSVDHDEGHMPETEFQKSNSVTCDAMEEAESPETGAVLDIALQRTKLCSFYQQGFCKMGRSCKFAHEMGELRSRPNLFRTNLCFAFSRGRCKRGDTCKYAHGSEQLQGNSAQDLEERIQSEESQLDIAEEGETEKKTMQFEIARALLGPSSSKVTDVGAALGVQVLVKNTFVHFTATRFQGRRRAVSCDR